MSSSRPEVREEELHAYVDGRLAEERRGAVEAYLAAHPEEARRIGSYRHQNELLRRAFQSFSHAPARPLVAAAKGRLRSASPAWLRVAAALLLLLTGLAAGWFGRGHLEGGGDVRLLALATEAHRLYVPEQRHPVEVGAGEEAHLVGWLSKRLDHPLAAPSLAAQGYELVGGRLLPAVGGRPAAQFMYENAQGRRVTCYITRAARPRAGSRGERGFTIAEREGATAFLWYEEGLAYALVGDAPREELLALARLLHANL